MRAYKLAWETLRDKGEISLAAQKNLHDRIHKAIRKEAALDKNFRDTVIYRGGKFYISKTWVGQTVTFKMVWTSPCKPPLNK